MDELALDANVRREVFAFLENATSSLGDVYEAPGLSGHQFGGGIQVSKGRTSNA
jgi:hypothetical protein